MRPKIEVVVQVSRVYLACNSV